MTRRNIPCASIHYSHRHESLNFGAMALSWPVKKKNYFHAKIMPEIYSTFICRQMNEVALVQNYPLWLLEKQILFGKYYFNVYA
jgi:hypothetical protein